MMERKKKEKTVQSILRKRKERQKVKNGFKLMKMQIEKKRG